jgi:hypothetical protein
MYKEKIIPFAGVFWAYIKSHIKNLNNFTLSPQARTGMVSASRGEGVTGALQGVG